jgi:SAM-dependent methyltransferase
MSMQLLVDLHISADRQGPGGAAETLLAAQLAGLTPQQSLRIADLGCGTGAAALTLAENLNASVTAVDAIPEFLTELEARAKVRGLGGRIQTLCASMDELPFPPGEFDVIWSEGAVYNIGFERGARLWAPLLKSGGILAVSELTWLTQERPVEIQEHWHKEYPGIATAPEKIEALHRVGLELVGSFALPRPCWTDNYYAPLLARLDGFLERADSSPEALEIAAAERREAELYERFGRFFGYFFFVFRKP